MHHRPSWTLLVASTLLLAFTGCESDVPPGEEPPEDPTPEELPDDACEGENPCTLRTVFGDPDELELYIDGIFAIWWYPEFDHADDAVFLGEQLNIIRRDCLDNLGMADPPNPPAGYYYNVYIHHGAADPFPEGWANGQGTDSNGMPFLTLPEGAHVDVSNLHHEGFHIFQYSATSPGFAYSGDSQWYVESSAQWYAAANVPDELTAFVEAGAIAANPHLTLWHSFSNEAPGDPTDWLFQVRQYGMHTWLFFLSDVAGVPEELITNGFYAGTDLSPQRYHYTEVGGDTLRGHFADWAAHNTGGFDYLTEEQVERAWMEVDLVGDPDNLHPFALDLEDSGSDGQFLQPPEALTPRGWSYSVVRVHNTEAVTYSFQLEGDATGSEGADSHFEARIVVLGSDGPRYSELTMSDTRTGTGSVAVEPSDDEVLLVVAAVPEHFTGNQTYGYSVLVERE